VGTGDRPRPDDARIRPEGTPAGKSQVCGLSRAEKKAKRHGARGGRASTAGRQAEKESPRSFGDLAKLAQSAVPGGGLTGGYTKKKRKRSGGRLSRTSRVNPSNQALALDDERVDPESQEKRAPFQPTNRYRKTK